MRIVIGGGGEISLQFARELSADYDVVVIEDDPEISRPFEVLDVQIARGKPTHIATLQDLELSARDKFVACSVRRACSRSVLSPRRSTTSLSVVRRMTISSTSIR